MAKILNDREIKRLFGTVISQGDESSIRPNSYILRLGSDGEFIGNGKKFSLGKKTRGIKLPPGNSVGITSLETIDFTKETVENLFPGCNLHGILSPTTDLSREGIVAATTQIDAGYTGTLNWTINNTSSKEARFVYGEKLFRLTILKLEEDENPENLYSGHYQGRDGYVSSQRAGAPVGMRENEWEDAIIEGGPENKFDELIKSGYPWNILGTRLKRVDDIFETVTDEYAKIGDSIDKLNTQVSAIQNRQTETSETIREQVAAIQNRQTETSETIRKVVREELREEIGTIQNRWLVGAGGLLILILGIVISAASQQSIWDFIISNGALIGGLTVIAAVVLLFKFFKRK